MSRQCIHRCVYVALDFSVATNSSSCCYEEKRSKMFASDIALKCQIGDAHTSDKSSISKQIPHNVPTDYSTSNQNHAEFSSVGGHEEVAVKYRDASTQMMPYLFEFKISVLGEEKFAFNGTPDLMQ